MRAYGNWLGKHYSKGIQHWTFWYHHIKEKEVNEIFAVECEVTNITNISYNYKLQIWTLSYTPDISKKPLKRLTTKQLKLADQTDGINFVSVSPCVCVSSPWVAVHPQSLQKTLPVNRQERKVGARVADQGNYPTLFTGRGLDVMGCFL